jgi:exodeoxyribonuclease VIII
MQRFNSPGLTYGMLFDDYLKLPGMSASQLKVLARSPLAFRWAQDHPDHTSSPSQALGTAAHMAILEPKRMLTDCILWDGGTRRGKAWDEFKAAYAGRQILTQDEFRDVQGMHDAVRGFAPAARYLEDGHAEVTMRWAGPGGREMRGRIDWLTRINGVPVIVDLKTCRDATPRAFGAQAFRLGYHIQFAIYADGFRALTGEDPLVVVLAVENGEPWEPAVFRVPEEVLDRGREDYLELLDVLDECERTGTWPPAADDELDLALPAWAMGEDDDVSGLGLDLNA